MLHRIGRSLFGLDEGKGLWVGGYRALQVECAYGRYTIVSASCVDSGLSLGGECSEVVAWIGGVWGRIREG